MTIKKYFNESLIKTSKIKNIFSNSDIKNTENNKNYLSLMKNIGIIKYDERGNSGNKTSDSPEKYKLVDIGDLVINPMNVTIGSVGVSKYSGCLSSVYIVLKPKQNINSKYYHYVFQDKGFQKYLKTISYGIMEIRESLNKTEFFQLKIPFPSIDEQSKISAYLDKKTEKIDDLIKKIEEKKILFKEQEKSLIHKVITKGLNNKVKIKNSGKRWIGDIPIHWKMIKLKFLFSLIGGKDPKNIESVNGNYPVLGTGGEVGRGKEFLFDKKTLLVGRKGTVDKPYIFDEPFWVSDVMYFTVQKTQMTPDYLFYLFTTFPFERYIYGSAQPSMSRVDYENHHFPVPPIEEQKKILEYLKDKTELIKKMSRNQEKKIKILKELKYSLISEVIAGRKKLDRMNGE